MRQLFDTHIAIWYILSDDRLPLRARSLLADPSAENFVSTASIWEIAIKFSLRKGRADAMPFSGYQAISLFEQAGFDLLPVGPSDAAGVESLPHYHHDPFDRLMIAQARNEAMRFVSHDSKLAEYGSFVEIV